jgi:serine-type D-Ala-D-Ala carboxypeptidase
VAAAPPLPRVPPLDAGSGFDPAPAMAALLEGGITDGIAPGAVALLVVRQGIAAGAASGRTERAPGAPRADADTIWDLASLTKVVATTTAAMILEERGRLVLDTPAAVHLPELASSEKASITPRMLLRHRAGFEAVAPLHRSVRGTPAYIREIASRPLLHPPGTRTLYSDWGPILLGELVARAGGRPLDVFCQQEIFGPLGMTSTGFRPPEDLRPRIAPTEVQPWRRPDRIHGEVHDENAWAMGGVAGHAGLFGSASDLARFAAMLLGGARWGERGSCARRRSRDGPGSVGTFRSDGSDRRPEPRRRRPAPRSATRGSPDAPC